MDSGNRVFALGAVFTRAFAVIGGAAPVVFGLSFLFGAIPQAIWGWFLPQLLFGAGTGNGVQLGLLAMFGGFLLLALNIVLQAALVRVVIEHGEGRRASMSQGLATGISMILPLLGLAILTMLGMMAGMILLIVPGIMLGVMWSVAGPALVDERAGIVGALGRSRYLTKGVRWNVFGLLALVLVMMSMITSVATFATIALGAEVTALGQAPSPAGLLIGLIFNTLSSGFWATMLTALFVELRNWKEGLDPGNLAEVFS